MEIPYESFKSSLPIQIRFGDIDALGHINNNVYYSYFDLGKTHYFEKLKAESVSWIEGMIVLARTETDFILPVFYKESIAVDTKIIKLGEKSGVFLQQIRNADNDDIKCRCKSVFVAFNPKTASSMEIPSIWRKAISEYEGIEL